MRINSALDFRHPSESHTLLKDSLPSLRYQRASAVVVETEPAGLLYQGHFRAWSKWFNLHSAPSPKLQHLHSPANPTSYAGYLRDVIPERSMLLKEMSEIQARTLINRLCDHFNLCCLIVILLCFFMPWITCFLTQSNLWSQIWCVAKLP